MEITLEQFNQRFGEVDRRFEQVDQRFEKVEQRLEHLEKKFEELKDSQNKRFGDLEKIVADGQAATTRWMVGLFISFVLIALAVSSSHTASLMLSMQQAYFTERFAAPLKHAP